MLDPAALAADVEAAIDAVADVTVSWSPSAGGAAQSAPAIRVTPTEDTAGGMVRTGDHIIRYAGSRLVGLEAGEVVTIAGTAYRVRETPQRLNDGREALALLAAYPA